MDSAPPVDSAPEPGKQVTCYRHAPCYHLIALSLVPPSKKNSSHDFLGAIPLSEATKQLVLRQPFSQ